MGCQKAVKKSNQFYNCYLFDCVELTIHRAVVVQKIMLGYLPDVPATHTLTEKVLTVASSDLLSIIGHF